MKARLFSVGEMVRIDWLLIMAQPSNHQHAYPAARKPGHLLRRVLTRLLCVLLARTDTDYAEKTQREEDLLWWNERDRGQVKETVRSVEIEAGGGLRIHAGLTHVTI